MSYNSSLSILPPIGRDSTVPLTFCCVFFACDGVNVTECDLLNAVSVSSGRPPSIAALGSGLINVMRDADASLNVYCFGLNFHQCNVCDLSINKYLSLACISALTDISRACRKSHSSEKAASPGVTKSGSC